MADLNDIPLPVPAPEPRLSKSKYLAGLQCLKRLYLQVHAPHLATPPDASTQAMLDMGTEIGTLARTRFPGGVLVEAGHRQREVALARTAELVADPTVPAIFEGALYHDGVLVRVDILERVPPRESVPECWRLIEVKSSTRVKQVHLDDLAIQSHVLLGTGLSLESSCLMHINTEYIKGEEDVDLTKVFAIEDVTEVVKSKLADVVEQVGTMKSMLRSSTAPLIEPDGHCQSPYECPFWNHCTKEKPARWIYYLPGKKDLVGRLVQQGVTTIDEIPVETKLSEVQKRVKENVEWVSPQLGRMLRTVKYPVHHFDAETVMLALPRFSLTRPYQAIPIQWSNHIELESGDVTHHEFLHAEASEPRRRWADAMIESLGTEGSIVVYSSYEEAILRQLAETFPEYKSALMAIVKRLWDLLSVIKDHYYHPAFNGSYSIKSVLPAVVPSLGYEDLVIQDGGQAAAQYYRMVFVETDWIEQLSIKEALLRYCERDTLAMVELRRVLSRRATGRGE